MPLIRIDKSMIAALTVDRSLGLIREAPSCVGTKRSPQSRTSAQMTCAVLDLWHCAKVPIRTLMNGSQESSPLLINARISLNWLRRNILQPVALRNSQQERSLRKMLIIFGCFAGIIFGLIFNVAILLPVTLVGAIAYAAASAGQNPLAVVLAIVILTVSLQAGYVIGLTFRDLFAQILARLNIVQSKRV
jgi:hypothetical protein